MLKSNAVGPTMTGIGEIIHLFEGRAIPQDFRVSFTFMLPLITDRIWGLFNNTYCTDTYCTGLLPQSIHSVFVVMTQLLLHE